MPTRIAPTSRTGVTSAGSWSSQAAKNAGATNSGSAASAHAAVNVRNAVPTTRRRSVSSAAPT
jgi:hypothetical protein